MVTAWSSPARACIQPQPRRPRRRVAAPRAIYSSSSLPGDLSTFTLPAPALARLQFPGTMPMRLGIHGVSPWTLQSCIHRSSSSRTVVSDRAVLVVSFCHSLQKEEEEDDRRTGSDEAAMPVASRVLCGSPGPKGEPRTRQYCCDATFPWLLGAAPRATALPPRVRAARHGRGRPGGARTTTRRRRRARKGRRRGSRKCSGAGLSSGPARRPGSPLPSSSSFASCRAPLSAPPAACLRRVCAPAVGGSQLRRLGRTHVA